MNSSSLGYFMQDKKPPSINPAAAGLWSLALHHPHVSSCSFPSHSKCIFLWGARLPSGTCHQHHYCEAARSASGLAGRISKVWLLSCSSKSVSCQPSQRSSQQQMRESLVLKTHPIRFQHIRKMDKPSYLKTQCTHMKMNVP